MCGIVACKTEGEAADYLIPALRGLEYRGYDSAGIALTTEEGGTAVLRTVRRVDDLARKVEAWDGPVLGPNGIGHTRWATHGSVNEQNAHPHVDCTGRLAVVHNGIIDNAEHLKASLEREGHVFSSDVDTEVICHLVEAALLRDGQDLHSAVEHAVEQLSGSWALVVMEAATERMAAAVQGSPLVMAHSSHGIFLASDVAAIAEWVDEFRVLRDGDVVEVAEIPLWSRHGTPIAIPEPVASTVRSADLRLTHHSDFMDKEIDEQPEVAARILSTLAPGITDGDLWASLRLPEFDRVAMLGCGTSLNAGKVIGNALSRLGKVPSLPLVASETVSTGLEPGTLVVAISQSGETADVLRALDIIDKAGCPLVAITNNPHSSLGRRADSVVNCLAGPEVGVAASKTFTAQVITGVSFVLSALVATRRVERTLVERWTTELMGAPDLIAQAIAVAREAVPPIAAELTEAEGFVFLGRGSGVAYAEEGALKLKELTYRWAEAQPAGELKHGPLALIESGTPVVVVDNGDSRLAGNISEVRARGGRVITIGGADSTIPALGQSITDPVPGGMESWGPLESVVPMQLLARELALALGRDVDKPRNLAKSVTVD
ncbi:glutamine--fructose-6-phosphate transaminase (isomerizing) [Ruicaihuangia caeni]|uniref:glutamine--fructose-6-phosphate transaminase (isomerizing) n=1 Tax=Ruicaihuangia caeni TaxID=3042517 RepID=UPI00338FE479